MKLINEGGLVQVEENDTDFDVAMWLIQNTTCPYPDFDFSQWYKKPKPGDYILLGRVPPFAILQWQYEIIEKGETSQEEKFKQFRAALVAIFGGEDSAQVVIARLAREHMLGRAERFEEFYQGGRIDTLDTRPEHTVVREVDVNRATWGHDETTKK